MFNLVPHLIIDRQVIIDKRIQKVNLESASTVNILHEVCQFHVQKPFYFAMQYLSDRFKNKFGKK